MKKYVFGLIVLLFFVNIGYSLTINSFTYNCTTFNLNITRNYTYNYSLINISVYVAGTPTLIYQFWMNNTNHTFNFTNLNLYNKGVTDNGTIIITEVDTNSSTLSYVNNTNTTVKEIPSYTLEVLSNTTRNYPLSGVYFNLSIEGKPNYIVNKTPNITTNVYYGCLVTVNSYNNSFDGRAFYNLYPGSSFYVTGNTVLNITYRTLLNNSKINVTINGQEYSSTSTSKVYVPVGSLYKVQVVLLDEENNYTLSNSETYIIFNQSGTPIFSGLNNTSFVNETETGSSIETYSALVNYSTIYNNTTIPSITVIPTKTWYVVSSSTPFVDYSKDEVSCAYISEYGWNYVKKLLNTTVFYLSGGNYINCNSGFLNFNNVNNLTLIGLNNTIIGGNSNIVISFNNSSNITLYNMTIEPSSTLISHYIIYLNNSSNINISNDNIYANGLFAGDVYEIYMINSSLNIYNTKMNVSIILGGDLYDIYSINSRVNLLNDNFSTSYYDNTSVLIEGIYSQNSSVNVNSSIFYDLKVGINASLNTYLVINNSTFREINGSSIYLNKPSYVNVSNTNFYNDKYTIYSEDPSSYLALYTSNDFVEDGTYTGYIITVRNSILPINVTNRTYNGKYVFKLIVINSSDVNIVTIGNNPVNTTYEYGYDKIILLNVTNAWLHNIIITNTEKGIVVWPNITELYLNYVIYSPYSLLSLPDDYELVILNSIFNTSIELMDKSLTEQYIIVNNTSFNTDSNIFTIYSNNTLINININLLKTQTSIPSIIRYNSVNLSGYVILNNSTIGNVSSVISFNTSNLTGYTVLVNNTSFYNISTLFNINNTMIYDYNDVLISYSKFDDVGHLLGYNNDDYTQTLAIGLLSIVPEIVLFNDRINDINYVISINNTTVPFIIDVDKINVSNSKYLFLFVNNTNEMEFNLLSSFINNSSNGIYIDNGTSLNVTNTWFENIGTKTIFIENDNYTNIILDSIFENNMNSTIVSKSSWLEINNVVINNSTYTITSIYGYNSTINMENVSILDNNIENGIELEDCNYSNLTNISINGNVFQGTAPMAIIYKYSRNVNISNINISNNKKLYVAIYLYDDNLIPILNNITLKDGKYGIELDDVNSVKMTNITMSYLDYGFYEKIPSNYFSIYNVVLDNINVTGIYLSGPLNFTIGNVTITNIGWEEPIPVATGRYQWTSTTTVPANFLVYGAAVTNGSCIYVTSGKNGTIKNITLTNDDFNGIYVNNSNSINIDNINATNYCKTFNIFEVKPLLTTVSPIPYYSVNSSYISATCGPIIKIYYNCLGINVNNVYGSRAPILVDIEGVSGVSHPLNINISNVTGINIAPFQIINNSSDKFWVTSILSAYSNYFFKKYYNIKDGLARRPGYGIIVKYAENITLKNVNITDLGKGFAKIKNSTNIILLNTRSNISELGFNESYYPLGVDIENSTSVNIENSTYSSFMMYGIYVYNLTGESIFFNNTLYMENNSSTIALYITNSTPIYLNIKDTRILNQNPERCGTGAIVKYSENITFNGDNISKTYYGIYIDNSSNTQILNSVLINNTIGLKTFYSKEILVNNTYFNLSYLGIWIMTLLGTFNLNVNYFYNTTYPVFVDANNRPPTNITNLSYFDTGSDYVVNYVNGSLVTGYIVSLKNVTSLDINNNVCYTAPCTGERIYALYLYNASTANGAIVIQNSQFISNGNGILAEDIYGVNFTNDSFQFNLNGISIYNSEISNLSYCSFYKNKYYTMYIYNLNSSYIINTNINYTRVTEIDNSWYLTISNITVLNNNETGLKFSLDHYITFEKFYFNNIGVPMNYWLGLTHQIKYPILDLRIINTPAMIIENGVFRHKNRAYTSNLVTHSNFIRYINTSFYDTNTGIAMSYTDHAIIRDSVFKYNSVGVLLFTFTYRKFTSDASLLDWYENAIKNGYFFRGDNDTVLENDTFQRNSIGLKINGVNYTFVNDSDFENNTQTGIEIQARLWGVSNTSCNGYYLITRVYQPNYYIMVYNDKFYDNNNALNMIDYTQKTELPIQCPANPNSLSVLYYDVKMPNYPDNIILLDDNISYNNYAIKTGAISKLYVKDSILYENNNASLLKYSTNIYYENDNILSQKISGINAISVGGIFLINYCTMFYNPKTLILVNPTGYYKISNSVIEHTPDNVTNISCASSKVGNFIVDNDTVEYDNGSFIYGLLNVYNALEILGSRFEYNNGSVVLDYGHVGNLSFEGNTVYKINGSALYLYTTRPFAVVNVENNNLTDVYDYGFYIKGVKGDNITWLNVTGNTFTNVNGVGFKSTEEIVGNANVSYDDATNVKDYFAYITGFNTPNEVQVTYNTIENSDNGIYLSGRMGKINMVDDKISYNNGFGLEALGNINGLTIETSNINNDNGTGVYVQNISSGNIYITQSNFINDNETGLYIGTNGPANIKMELNNFTSDNEGFSMYCYKAFGNISISQDDFYYNNVSAMNITCPIVYNGSISNIVAKYTKYALGSALALSLSNTTITYTNVINNTGTGITIFKSYNVTMEDGDVIRNNTGNGIDIFNTNDSRFVVTSIFNQGYGVYVAYSSITFNQSNISWNGNYGVNVISLFSNQKVFFNYSYICYNLNGESYDIENLNYTTSFLAVLHSQFGITNPSNPYQTFFVANQYLNAYPDDDYFCNATKQGFGNNVGAGKITNITVVKIPFLPKATSYVMVVKGTDVGAVVLAKTVVFRPFCPVPKIMGSGKYVLIINHGRISVA